MGELKFKVGDKVMAFVSGGPWRDAEVIDTDAMTSIYRCKIAGMTHPLWVTAGNVQPPLPKRSNGTVTERLRRQVTEQAQEIERLKALVSAGEEARVWNSELCDKVSDLNRRLAESEAQKAAIAEAALGVEREARKSVEVEAASCAKLRDLLADAQRGEKRARRTVELMRCVLNMVGEE